jgi:hypothetical protein
MEHFPAHQRVPGAVKLKCAMKVPMASSLRQISRPAHATAGGHRRQSDYHHHPTACAQQPGVARNPKFLALDHKTMHVCCANSRSMGLCVGARKSF